MTVNLCVNTEYGALSDRLNGVSVELEDWSFTLSPNVLYDKMDGPPIRFDKECFMCYGRTFGYTELGQYVGNIFWNSYALTDSDVAGFCQALKLSGEWGIDEGPTEFWKWWDKITHDPVEFPTDI